MSSVIEQQADLVADRFRRMLPDARERLAGQAMQGILASMVTMEITDLAAKAASESGCDLYAHIARHSVALADALIAELAKGRA